VPGKNSLRALVSEALPPDLGGKAVGAGDPGISTFITVAVVDGPVLKLGEGLATHVLQSYGRHIDALEARIKEPRLVCAQRMSMARRITRLRRGAKNTVKQAAHEYALLIAARFKVFFLPHFRVSEMVVGSPLGKKVTRKMPSICHGVVRRLLMEKAAVNSCREVFVRGMLVWQFLLVYCAVDNVCSLVTTAVHVVTDRRGVDDEDLLQLRAREPPRGCSLRVLLPLLWPHRGPGRAGGGEHPGTWSQRAP
jgi:hypothetical protein